MHTFIITSCTFFISDEVKHIVIGMPHRGRTNFQTIMLNLKPAKVFHKLRGESEFPDGLKAMSDVITHFSKL